MNNQDASQLPWVNSELTEQTAIYTSKYCSIKRSYANEFSTFFTPEK